MNDRYLYRAKRIDNGEWVVGYIVKRHGLWFIYGIKNADTCRQNNYEVDASTICQCTGLRDVHEKLIFENDIVREKFSDCIGVVKFGKYEKGYGWHIKWITEKAKLFREDLLYWQNIIDVEEVGNVFDNPDLLEV